jgi:uncharacterized protein
MSSSPIRSFAHVALLACLAVAPGCRKPTSAPKGTGVDTGTFDRGKLVEAFGVCAVDTYRAFDVAAADLAKTTDTLRAAPTSEHRAAAREAWSRAMDAWQQVEVMQIGPLAPAAMPGGKGLRDAIYAWPLFGRCLIDESIVSRSYESPDFSTTALANVRGLAATEYLLFEEGATNGCGSSSTINATGSWAALTADDRAARRASYAAVATADTAAQAHSLVALWEGGGFLGQVKTAGHGSTVFATDQQVFNAVNDALFYVEAMDKDVKVALPLGLGDPETCAEPPCPELLESKFSHRSRDNLRSNLIAFRKLFEGCGKDFEGLGFDDLLVAVGASHVATTMKGDLAAVMTAIDALPYPTLEEALAKDPASVRAIYDALKNLTEMMKTEFIGVLDLELPKRVEGDND